MREVIRGNTKEAVEQKIKRMRGWYPVSDIVEDPSFAIKNVIEYVCVMETKDKPHTKSNWGNRYHLY